MKCRQTSLVHRSNGRTSLPSGFSTLDNELSMSPLSKSHRYSLISLGISVLTAVSQVIISNRPSASASDNFLNGSHKINIFRFLISSKYSATLLLFFDATYIMKKILLVVYVADRVK